MVSLQKKSPLNIKENRFQHDIVDISTRMNQLRISAISKAVALTPHVHNVTLGPNSLSDISLDNIKGTENDFQDIITSTPHQEQLNTFRRPNGDLNKVKKSLFDVSGIEDHDQSLNVSRYNDIAKKQAFCELQKKRKEEVQRKIYQRFKIFKQEEERINECLEESRILITQNWLAETVKEFEDYQKLLKEEEAKVKLNMQELSKRKNNQDEHVNKMNERIKELERKRLEIEEKERQIKQERYKCLGGIYEKQKEYRKIYEEILNIFKTWKDSTEISQLITSETPKLKNFNETFDMILDKCENDVISQIELRTSQDLVRKIKNIHNALIDIINKHNQKIEDEKKKKLEELNRIKKEKKDNLQSINKPGLSDWVDKESLNKSVEINKFLTSYEKQLEPLLEDKSLSKLLLNLKKAVVILINAISDASSMHLQDKFTRLSDLLRGKSVSIQGSYITSSVHPLGTAYCTYVAAKNFIEQGENTVSSKPEAAFAIAAVIVALWVEFPDFGQMLLGYFQQKCPYLIPAYKPQLEGQTNEDYYKSLGYRYEPDGQVEPHIMFLKRMTGIIRLYSAILITKLNQSHRNKTHPFGIQESWRLLAGVLNLAPRPDISATIIHNVLDICGHLAYKTYGYQFQKMLLLLCKDYFPKIEKVSSEDCCGPVIRLKTFLEKILIEGRIPPPKGELDPNFW
uniref:mRNA export factor GLE1 n=1 Tax=Clastoptera arizonana TaxID=38151 RepID=A0A1B6CGR4_9HEMI